MITLSRRRSALFAGATALGLVAGGMAASLPAFGAERVRVADGFGPGDGLDRYVVALSPGATEADVAVREGVRSVQPLTGGGSLVATTLTRRQVAALPGVASAQASPQGELFGSVDPTDPDLARLGWNLRNTGSNAYGQPATAGADTGAADAWAVTRGAGTVIAVVDSGFDSDHPDLVGALWTNPQEACGKVDTDGDGKAGDCHGWNFVKNSADVDNGTGSAGVAPSAKIMPLVVGTGSTVDVNLGIEAIRYAADHGADVIDAS